MVVHWSLSDSKSPQVSRTHLRILAVLSNAVIRIVSTRPPTSVSYCAKSTNHIIIIIIIIIIYSLEFFKPALADGLSLGFEWQQVSSSHRVSSQYSGRSQ